MFVRITRVHVSFQLLEKLQMYHLKVLNDLKKSQNRLHERVIHNVSINLLRWNDVPRTSGIFCSKIATLSQF